MAMTVLAGALRNARDSWRGQLALLLVGAVLSWIVGLLGFGAAAGAFVLCALLLAGAVRAADLQLDEFGAEAILSEVFDILALAPRLLTQVVLSLLPALGFGFMTLQLAGALPLLGLLLMPLAFVVAIGCAPVALLSVVAVVRGDNGWLPNYGLHAVRGQPWALMLATVVGAAAAFLAAVPVVLVGFVLTSTLGPLGALGIGLASTAIIPLTGCWALALWEAAGLSRAESAHRAEPPAAEARIVGPSAAPAWVDGPTWNAAIEPQAVWGTWVRLDVPAEVGLRLSWSGSEPPRLLMGREDGTWADPGAFLRPGAIVVAPMDAGNTYLQVAVGGSIPQAVTLTMLVRAAAAA